MTINEVNATAARAPIEKAMLRKRNRMYNAMASSEKSTAQIAWRVMSLAMLGPTVSLDTTPTLSLEVLKSSLLMLPSSLLRPS